MISELPGDVKRRVLGSAFPHIYQCVKKNPILLEFVRSIILKAPNAHYSSIVLIDFIANNLDVCDNDNDERDHEIGTPNRYKQSTHLTKSLPILLFAYFSRNQ